MIAVRRWYIFLVCAVSLHSVTWAGIALLRNLLAVGRQTPLTTIALQVAILIIGLPLFLVHWLWAQRLATRDVEERESAVRRLYLYGTLGGLLAPFIANAFSLLWTLLWLALGGASADFSVGPEIIRNGVAMLVLAVWWVYHQRVLAADIGAAPGSTASSARRLYVFGFAGTGLVMTTLGVIRIVRLIMVGLASGSMIATLEPSGMAGEVARLVVGLPLWLVFWAWAQRLFGSPNAEERESALRKLYLYLAVLVATLTTVTNAAFLITGLFRRVLDLPSQGNLRVPLPVMIALVGVWAFHAYALRGDAAAAREAPRQAAIRRLYLYLVAGVGLAALLVGFSGDITVLIRSLAGGGFGEALKEQLAWSTAALIAGLPVWLVPWRQAQTRALATTPDGSEERRSVVRKIYLYFFLFVATMAVLASAVYIVWQLLTIALGGRAAVSLPANIAQAVAYLLIGLGIWLYHGMALRGDGRLGLRERLERLGSMRVAVVDSGDGRFGRAVLDGLRRDIPGLVLDPIGLTEEAARQMGSEGPTADRRISPAERLGAAGIIIGPWQMVVPGSDQDTTAKRAAQAILRSEAHKLLAPMRAQGWDWAGVEPMGMESFARQAVHAVRQLAAGEEIKPARPLSAGAIIGIVLGVLFLLILIVVPMLNYFT